MAHSRALLTLAAVLAAVTLVVLLRDRAAPRVDGLANEVGAPASLNDESGAALSEQLHRSGSGSGRAAVETNDETPRSAPAEQVGEEPKRRPSTITGIVVDPSGAPLRGVAVMLALEPWGGYEGGRDGTGAAREVDASETDAQGAFALDPGGARLVRVSASAADRPTRTVGSCAPGARLRIVLAPGASIEGLVTVAADAAPVVDAVVKVHHGGPQDEIAIVRTDAAGRYRARGLLDGEGGVLVVPREHAMARWYPFELKAGAHERIDVEVEAGWALAGRIRDAKTGDAIAGARVSPWEFNGKVFLSDEQGNYRVEGTATRPGTLSVDAPGYGRSEVRYEAPRLDLDVALRRSMTVKGTVVDSVGAPAAGAVVTAAALKNEGRLARREWSTTRADGSGGFEFSGLRADIVVTLQALAPDHGATLLAVPSREGGGVIDVGTLRLEPQGVLAGRVLAAGGAPAAGAWLLLTGPREIEFADGVAFHFGRVRATASEDGAFFLPGLAAGTWDMAVHQEGGRVVELEVKLAAGEVREDLVVQMPGGAPMLGRVVDEQGRGMPRALVVLFPEEGQPGPPLSGECDGAGDFEIADVPEGKFTGFVTAGEPRGDGPSAPLYVPTVAQGLTADGSLRRLVLERLDGKVTGRVVDAGGQPVADAYVSVALEGFDAPWIGVLTDAQGGFELAVRAKSPTTLIAWRTTALDDSRTPTGTEWSLGREILDDTGPAGRVVVPAGATEAQLRVD